MSSPCTTPNNSNKRYSHIDTNYDYSSPVLKRATKPLMSETGPSTFKYCPILSNCHLMLEPYCDTCWGMRGTEQRGYDLHLLEAHNYACPNHQCPLQFVEQKHLRKHLPICAASLLLQSSRKLREKACNHLINFPKQIPKTKRKPNSRKKSKKSNTQRVAEQEKVWITCYPDATYCALQLCGYDDTQNALDKPQCSDATYIDPAHNPPIPMNECYFNDMSMNVNVNVNVCEGEVAIEDKNECKNIENTNNNNKAEMDNDENDNDGGDSESSSSSDSDSDSDSDTQSEHDNSSDSDEENDKNVNDHDSNHNNNDNGNDNEDVDGGDGDGGDRSIRKIRPPTHNNNHNHNHNVHGNGNGNGNSNDVIMIDVHSSDDNSSLATFPSGKSTDNNTVQLHLPNLDYTQPQPLPPSIQHHNNHNYAGYKRKAQDMAGVNDNINVMQMDMALPPFKKQKLFNNMHMAMPVSMNNDIQIPKIATSANGFISNITATFIGSGNGRDSENENVNDMKISFPSFTNINSIISSSNDCKFNGLSNGNTIWNRMSTNENININHNKPEFGIKSSKKHKNKHKHKKKSKSKKKRTKIAKKRVKNNANVINLIDEPQQQQHPYILISDDSDTDNNNNMLSLSQVWCKLSKADKFQYIFHPYHIYSVSQQFVFDKNDKKSKKKKSKKKKTKKKENEIKCYYKLDSCTAEWREPDLNAKWMRLQPDFAEMKRNNLKTEKFNGSEISFEFLNFVQLVPFEDKLQGKHVITRSKLGDLLSKLFMSDSGFKYLQCYGPLFSSKMQQLLTNNHDLSLNCRIFLYSFLRCGVGYLSHGFCAENVTKALHIHNAYYAFLNNHFKSQSVYKDFKLRDIKYKKDNAVTFKEFVFRNNYNIEDYSNCTIDLSLKMGGISCDELENLLEQNVGIQSLKTLYNSLYPCKQLRLVNIGFFQSPPTNPGQNWHTDFEFTSIHDEYTKLSPVVTVIVSLIKQKYDAIAVQNENMAKTSGSTVFCLGSNHSAQQIMTMCKKYPKECDNWLYRVIQPVLDKGDFACFAGHTMHFGGAYNYLCEQEAHEDRVVLYGILHLLPKDAKHDEYLQVDMNIMYLQQTQSLFGGGRYVIVSKDDNNDEEDDEDGDGNPYFVKKNRWRDRKS